MRGKHTCRSAESTLVIIIRAFLGLILIINHITRGVKPPVATLAANYKLALGIITFAHRTGAQRRTRPTKSVIVMPTAVETRIV